jgi:adenine-specific DNA-methyltransferase
MKYMGHKGRIVNAIKKQVERIAGDAHALCDAFCGSGVVAWNLAEQFNLPILAGDLQSYAVARAAGVVTRTTPLNNLDFLDNWIRRAERLVEEVTSNLRIPSTPTVEMKTQLVAPRKAVKNARLYASGTLNRVLRKNAHNWPITLAYAGYYFSIEQALALDALRSTMPSRRTERAVALSALIGAASRCSASPGHTAQPLGIGRKSLPHVVDAWNRRVFEHVREEVKLIAPRHAKVEGEAKTASWDKLIDLLSPRDVVFCDPPYSDVQYSRFYHVLETLARGIVVDVSGTGRNPPFNERPESQFSRKSKSMDEVKRLLKCSAERELRLVITFPVARQSNGLAAWAFVAEAKRYFAKVQSMEVMSVFSTLGGNGSADHRPSRTEGIEQIICCYS